MSKCSAHSRAARAREDSDLDLLIEAGPNTLPFFPGGLLVDLEEVALPATKLFADSRKLSKGDASLLQFAAVAEFIETDL